MPTCFSLTTKPYRAASQSTSISQRRYTHRHPFKVAVGSFSFTRKLWSSPAAQQSQQASHPMQGLSRVDSASPGVTAPPAQTQTNNHTTAAGLPAPASQPFNQMSRSQLRARFLCGCALATFTLAVIIYLLVIWGIDLKNAKEGKSA